MNLCPFPESVLQDFGSEEGRIDFDKLEGRIRIDPFFLR